MLIFSEDNLLFLLSLLVLRHVVVSERLILCVIYIVSVEKHAITPFMSVIAAFADQE